MRATRSLISNLRLLRQCLLLVGFLLTPVMAVGQNVSVIAHSISTRIEARKIMSEMGWTRVDLKNADYILAVCRSFLSLPLGVFYDSITSLDRDADSQLNISGSNMHAYVYQINNDLSVTEVQHDYWEANN